MSLLFNLGFFYTIGDDFCSSLLTVFFLADSSEFKAEPFLGGKVELRVVKEESPKDYNMVKQWSFQKSINMKDAYRPHIACV